jgi:hypothetical protein
LSGQTENAGHFLQPTAMAIGHSVMVTLLVDNGELPTKHRGAAPAVDHHKP